MLLFRAGGDTLMAVPLGLVARLEDIPRDKIEVVLRPAGHAVPRQADAAGLARRRDLIRTGRTSRCWCSPTASHSMGLMVDEIIDVVEDRLQIELTGTRPGLLGTAVIAGKSTDLIDTGYWLTQASQDWFRGAAQQRSTAPASRACWWSRTATSSASCWCPPCRPPATTSPP